MEFLGHLDLQEILVNQVLQVFLEIQVIKEIKDQQDQKEVKDSKAHVVNPEDLVNLVNQDHKVHKEKMDLLGKKEAQVQLDPLDHQDFQAQEVHLEFKEMKDLLV